MSEISFESPPRKPTIPEGSDSIGLRGPFFSFERRQVAFPDYAFELNPTRLVSDGVLEVTTESRVRYSLRQLVERCGDDFPSIRALATPQSREHEQKNAKKFLNGKVGLSPGNHAARRDVVDRHEATQAVLEHLYGVNHPVAQLLNQIGEELVNDDGGMRGGEFSELAEGLITVAAWPELRSAYQDQVEAIRQSNVA